MNYLYNGTELPDIYSVYTPELQEQYPFAYIGNALLGYFLYLTTAPCKVNQVDDGRTDRTGAELGTGLITYRVIVTLQETEWTNRSEGEVTGNYQYWNPIWANYDVETLDGKLFLEKSDPVPVNPVKLNPALLVQGFMVGQAVRRSRGK